MAKYEVAKEKLRDAVLLLGEHVRHAHPNYSAVDIELDAGEISLKLFDDTGGELPLGFDEFARHSTSVQEPLTLR